MALTPAQLQQMVAARQTVVSDLNSNNFAGAWNTALGTSSLYGTNMGAQTTDPLLAGLESSQGLQQLDPSKQWNSNLMGQYYNAFNGTAAYHGNNSGNNGYLGKNPYGVWGAASGIPGDITANAAQEGMTPDVGRFAGARPDKGWIDKNGKYVAAAALAVAAPYAMGAIAPMLGGGLIGATGAGALVGAGSGAVMGGVTGGNIGRDALIGGVTGGVAGGISAGASSLGAPSGVSSITGKVAGNMAQQQLFDGNGNPVGSASGSSYANAAGGGNSAWGALGAIGSGLLQANGAGNAAGQISNAANNAGATVGNYFGTAQAGLSPYMTNGADASNRLGNLMSGTGPSQAASFENTPGYQFALQQGMSGVNRNAAASGNLYSSGTLAAVGANQQGLASQNYQNYVGNLMSMAGLGGQAAGINAGAATQAGGNIASTQLTGGIARGNAAGSQGNTYGNLLGSLSNNNAFTSALGGFASNVWNGNYNPGVSTDVSFNASPATGLVDPSMSTPDFSTSL
jgi:hypothetical protein